MKYTPSVVNLIIGGIEVKSFPSGTGITLEFCQLYPFGYGINIFFRLSSNGTLIILDIDKFLRLSNYIFSVMFLKLEYGITEIILLVISANIKFNLQSIYIYMF